MIYEHIFSICLEKTLQRNIISVKIQSLTTLMHRYLPEKQLVEL